MSLTEQQKEVLRYAIDNGWATIEGAYSGSFWEPINRFSWSLVFTGKVELRIKQVPDSINWEHVSSEICGIARDEDGGCYGYTKQAVLRSNGWGMQRQSDCARVSYFSSYKRGTIDWHESWIPNPFHKDNQVKIEDSQK